MKRSRHFGVCGEPYRLDYCASVESAVFELGTDGPSRILVGVDGTDSSLRAAAYAAGMARRHGAQLIVLYVVPTSALAAQSPMSAGAMLATQAEIGEDIRTQLVEGTRRLGIDTELIVRYGNPYREMFDVAESRQVEAVIIGSSTRSGRRFVGSLAGRLVRDAAWPITVVP